MPGMKILPAMLCCLPALTIQAARAEWVDGGRVFEEDKPWVEVATQLPPYPKAANLIPFKVSPATRNRYFVDAESIGIGADEVIRYTVVIEAAGGARNVSYEGMRCTTGERRLYAYGQPDGSWSKARNAAWEGIQFRSQTAYPRALFDDVFCPDGLRVRDPAEAVRNLRQASR